MTGNSGDDGKVTTNNTKERQRDTKQKFKWNVGRLNSNDSIKSV